MEETFSVIMLALVNGQPKVLNLKQILYHYVQHQKDVVTRRTKFELNKAEARAHILEGLRIALDNIDAVISLIRASKTTQEAKTGLMEKFGLSEIQAQAILDMRLQRLTGLERDKIEAEYEELIKRINRLREILANERLLLNVIKEEMLIIKENYADERRTEIRHAEGEIDMRDLIEDEEIAITLTHFGYIKRLPADTYKSQKRGGRGVSALTTREEDFVKHLVSTTTHSRLLFFTNKGRVFRLNAYEIPEGKRQAKGTAIVNLLNLAPGEKIATLLAIDENDANKYLLLATKNGIVKKTRITEYANVRKSGLAAITLKENDELIEVKSTNNKKDIILITKQGMCIRFNEKDVRCTGRTSMGVIGMSLDVTPIANSAEKLASQVSENGGHDAAEAIMTTDTFPKECAVEVTLTTGETVKIAGGNPCPPIVLGVGIGGDFEYCAYLSKKALCRDTNERNSNPFYMEMEKELLEQINKTNIGPQGFGGNTTALAVNIETAPTHIAGLPVAVNVGCHVTRHASAIL